MSEIRTNWAGNIIYNSSQTHYPKSVQEVQELVSRIQKLKVLGSTHSFNDIADSTGDHISLDHLPSIVVINRENNTVTINANVRYGQVCEQLHREGYAFHNLASLPHISVIGACATATHGSGDYNGNLATAVRAMQIIAADGSIVELSRERQPDQFSGMVVGLGGLGVVTQLTLEVVPTFNVRQYVYQNLPFTDLVAHFDEIESSAYSVSLFTDWHDQYIQQVWLKCLDVEGANFEIQAELYGAKLATRHLHPIGSLSAESCTPQLGLSGPWYERLPHFRMAFTPSSGEELQSEYLVPRQQALAALQAVEQLKERIAPLLQICEVRTIAADNLWLSPCYQQPRVGLHFTWIKDWEAVRQLLPLIEQALEPFNAIPHWGKLFTMPASRVQALYPKLADFQGLLQHYDSQGKFQNAYLAKYILA